MSTRDPIKNAETALAQLEERDHLIAAQQASITQILDENAELLARIAEASRQFEQGRAAVEQISPAELRHLSVVLEDAYLTIAELRGSTSWRLTKPLRALKTAISNSRLLQKIIKSRSSRTASLSQQEKSPAPRPRLTSPHKEYVERVSQAAAAWSPVNYGAEKGGVHRSAEQSYIKQVLDTSIPNRSWGTEHVPYLSEDIDFSRSPLRCIAFYLPQFHPIAENDEWWGKGFTEWANVAKSMPQFVGHYQPRLPGELGYYDLRLIDVQRQQIELAKRYGIHGFCYHHYWFGGHRLLERPFQQILENPDLDLPFCLCWANENWTRRWDGQESDVLMAQSHSPEDDIAFIEDIADALRDPRYIRVDGKPVLIVYRVSLLPDAEATARRWRDYCIKAGIGDLYLVAARSFEVEDPRPYGFDAAVEFPPHRFAPPMINHAVEIVNPGFEGQIYQFSDLINWHKAPTTYDYTLFKTVTPGWDNSARKPGRGHCFHNASPDLYSDWLRDAAGKTLRAMNENPKHPGLVFINAWNEWAEGAYLEPDQRYGYAYLHATANILRDISPADPAVERIVSESQRAFRKRSDVALIVHLHYEDLFDEMLEQIKQAEGADVFISLNSGISPDGCRKIVAALPHCRLAIFPNRGRDIQPFLQTLKIVTDLDYAFACKVHAKKSLHRTDGTVLRRGALDQLLGSNANVSAIRKRFSDNDKLALVAPTETFLALDDPDRNVHNRYWLDRLLPKFGLSHLVGNYKCHFAAGSMFWFRVSAFKKISSSLNFSSADFEDELGQVDGTLAHSLERIFVPALEKQGFVCEENRRT